MRARIGQTYNCSSSAVGFQHWGYATKRPDGLFNFQADVNDEIKVLKPCQIHIVGHAEWHEPIEAED
jgi:hypothetical protein